MKKVKFICCFSLSTHFLMQYKRLSAFQWHSFGMFIYSLVCPLPVSSHFRRLSMYIRDETDVRSALFYAVLLFSLHRHYRSQINQHKANNQIVYIIYLSGAIQQVHLALFCQQTITIIVIVIVVFLCVCAENVHVIFLFILHARAHFHHENSCGAESSMSVIQTLYHVAIEWPFSQDVITKFFCFGLFIRWLAFFLVVVAFSAFDPI